MMVIKNLLRLAIAKSKVILTLLCVVAVLCAAYFLVPDAESPWADTPAGGSSVVIHEGASAADEAGNQVAAGSSQYTQSAGQQDEKPRPESMTVIKPSSVPGQTEATADTSAGMPNAAAATPTAAQPSATAVPQTSAPPTDSKNKITQAPASTANTAPTNKPVTAPVATSAKNPVTTTAAKPQAAVCTITIRCETALNYPKLDKSILPANGILLTAQEIIIGNGESAFDVLKSVTKSNKISFEFTSNPLYNSVYIEGIGGLYELDAGPSSGWTYRVNGQFPNYGCNRYILKSEDVLEFLYTCDFGRDIGGNISGQWS
jgi:hypothetical protein